MRSSPRAEAPLLILGASARALAGSAASSRRSRARFPAGVVALDYFGDVDLIDRRTAPIAVAGDGAPWPVRVLSVARDFGAPRTTASLGRAALTLDWSAIACAGGIENRPGLLRLLARRGVVLGSSPRAIAAVRDPATLFPFLAASGIPHAATLFDQAAPATPGRWLVKRRRSAGGGGVRPASPEEPRRAGEFFQRRIEGPAGSAAFVAAAGRAVLLGVSEELDDREMLGAPPFRYAGNILGPPGSFVPAEGTRLLARAASALAGRFGLMGLNGFDFVLDAGVPRVIEVNPRWTASMELVEEALGTNLFDLHLGATEGEWPVIEHHPDPRRRVALSIPRYLAKGILYATEPIVSPDPGALAALGARDRPPAGERILPGQPVCTLFARGEDRRSCVVALRDRARRARRLLRPPVTQEPGGLRPGAGGTW